MLVELCSAQFNSIAAAVAQSRGLIARTHNCIFSGATKSPEHQQHTESPCLKNGAGTFNKSLIHSTYRCTNM